MKIHLGALALGVWASSPRNRVVAARVPWVASDETPNSKPQAQQRPPRLHGLNGVTRAGRVKPAGLPKPWADQITVCLQNRDQDFLHWLFTRCQCLSRLWQMSLFAALAQGWRAIATISRPETSGAWFRKDSLTNLFIRLRRTAFGDVFFDTVIPSRPRASPFSLA